MSKKKAQEKENKKKPVSVIIPVYNEAAVINDVILKVVCIMKKTGRDYEILVVNDGSTDGTFDIIKNEGMIPKESITLLSHPYNIGYGAALKTGIRNSKHDIILFIDSDNQHDPEDIPGVLKYAEEYDMVIGSRVFDTNVSASRKIAKKIITGFANYMSDTKIEDLNSGFRTVKRDVIMPYLDTLPNRFSLTSTITIIAIRSGYSIKYSPISIHKRVGESKINPLWDFMNFMILIIRITMFFAPLKIFLPASLFALLAGGISITHDIIFGGNIADSSILLITSGLLLFFFGFLSDQISFLRMYRTKQG